MRGPGRDRISKLAAPAAWAAFVLCVLLNAIYIAMDLSRGASISGVTPGTPADIGYALALETLRDLARGIYPPLLADQGLGAALESQARKATVPVTVETEGVDRYPKEVEAAVYFCVLEALQNVQKYAGASSATVRLRAAADALTFEVEDDGAGFDAKVTKKGSGLTNMSDRLESLGGTVEVVSEPGVRTVVSGRLPTPSLVAG
jgi:signal transduction histidine kinase